MLSTLSYLKSVAASGTDSLVIALPNGVVDLHVQIAAEYAAAAATTGVQAAFQYSADGGNTYTNSAVKTVTAPGVAGSVQTVETKFGIFDIAMRKDPLPITHIKVNLTNEDATNAAVVAILTDYEQN